MRGRYLSGFLIPFALLQFFTGRWTERVGPAKPLVLGSLFYGTILGVFLVAFYARRVGGHAVFVDARTWLDHIPPLAYPGQSLVCALYLQAGIRSCEIGTVMFGRHPDGSEQPAALDLVRLAMPRRVYTQSHADYLIEAFEELAGVAEKLPGMEITEEPPAMRHFTAKFRPLGPMP